MYKNLRLATLLSAIFGLAQISAGATLCVSQAPSTSCPYSTITAAVSAASPGDIIQVGHGTYHEDIVVTKTLSLIGENVANTIIDATGLSNGIVVGNVPTPCGAVNGPLCTPSVPVNANGVNIANFTIQNANFEGILLVNVSSATVENNHVLKNNIALNPATFSCNGIPPFETNEGFDCGEGIHLSGVDHSVIANNLVEQNSGGILLSDDTGATHDNLILGNTVQFNPTDCGITLASHTLFGSEPPTAAGVYHNTIANNNSNHNGLGVPGAGAGVGLFAPAPWNKTYSNVVVNNTLTDNGLPGVSMHAHSPGATTNDNMIAANTLSGNGADTDDTATPGPTGINISGGDTVGGPNSNIPLALITGTVIAGNTIRNETIGIATKTNGTVDAHLNDFTNLPTGIDNIDVAGGTVNGSLNWWGCANGPGTPSCAGVLGNGIIGIPFLTKPF